jgi:hypothetical protein
MMSEQSMVDTLATKAKLFMAFALICLAAALVYVGYVIKSVSDDLPRTLDKFQQSTDIVLPLIDQTGEIIDLIPKVLAESQQLREQLPAILDEVAAVRGVVPSVLDEVAATRKVVPSVLEEVSAVRLAVPSVLTEVRKTRTETVPVMLQESAAVRAEVDKVLEALPPTLTRVEGIVQHADDVVSKVGEDAVKNVITGIVKSPVNLISDFGGKFVPKNSDTSEAERKQIAEAFNDMAKNGKSGDTRQIKNRRTGFEAKITLLEKSTDGGQPCYGVNVVTKRHGMDVHDENYNACQHADNVWKVAPLGE